MNSYTELLKYFKKLGSSDSLVNSIAQGKLKESQLNKSNNYPLLHIEILNASFPSDAVIEYNVGIACISKRDENKDINTDLFWFNDNEVDNYNETMAILNRLWLKMLKDFEENNITASENPSLEKIEEAMENVVDGWLLSFNVQVPNTIISLCE